LRDFAREGTSRNRAVWYWTATLPFPVRHGDPAGAAQDDIGQSLASTRRKSSPVTPRSFHVSGSRTRSYAPSNETEFALNRRDPARCFIGERSVASCFEQETTHVSPGPARGPSQ
jgi:hypothetical protein